MNTMGGNRYVLVMDDAIDVNSYMITLATASSSSNASVQFFF